MHPSIIARTHPDRTAFVMAGSGRSVSYRELDDGSNRVARWLRACGLQAGAHMALLLENQPLFFELAWGAQRAGIVYTPISTHLNTHDAAYIVQDCDARLLVVSATLAQRLPGLRDALPTHCRAFVCGGEVPGFEPLEPALQTQPALPIPDESAGQDMLYSSGTTGRPKGVVTRPVGGPIEAATPLLQTARERYRVDEDSVYLSPAPLYHAAPLRFTMTVMRLGGTCVIMERFDERRFLELIERHRVTHTQLVPTMFVRLLKLAPEERARHDLSSLRCAIHAAAPCPVPVKHAMIDWWGPVLWEYYAGTEGCGMTLVDSPDWLAHPGTVGRAVLGQVHICDDFGRELPAGDTGVVFFSGGPSFTYHKDEAKTAASTNDKGWRTLGDIGYLDPDGYLFLTDRKAYMIISGGVNIYPQEAENVLVTHPAVIDVAVFGIPDEEFGEQVKAVVQPLDMADAGPALEAELIEYCRSHLSPIKCPRSIDFDAALPREANGKLYKRKLRERYLSVATSPRPGAAG